MTDAAELATAVRRAVEAQPYMVTDEVEDGFTVQIDVVDQKWWTLMYRKSLSKTFQHVVRVDAAAGTYTVTDQSRTVRWEAGADVSGGIPRPTLSGGITFAKGTVVDVSFRKELGVDDDGNVGAVVDHTFNSLEGNRLIDAEAERLGLRKRLNNTAKFGLVVAIISLIGAVVAVVVLVATGAFG